ncbi:MAG: flagellar motor switch protein FliG [Paracoccaceae bacterium]
MSKDTALTVSGAALPGAAAKKRIPPRPKLGGRAKAAIIVRMLLNEGADLPLDILPDELQENLTQQMGQMGLVDRDTLHAVALEFAERLDGVGLSFPNGLGDALNTLDGKISPQTAARLRKEAGVRMAGDPWDQLRGLNVEELAPMVLAESTEIAAVILSKLDVPHAAALLGHLSGPDARRIALAVSKTGNVTPDVVDRIGLSLVAQLEDRPTLAFDAEPGARVGAILNLSPATIRADMLDALNDADAGFADAVRKSIFVFAHIPARLAAKDVPQVVRETDLEKLLQALSFSSAGSDGETAEFLLGNISTRMADGLREELAELPPVRTTDGEAAQNEIIASIRRLEEAGDLTLIIPEEDA